MKKLIIGIVLIAALVIVMLNLFQHPLWTPKQVQGDVSSDSKPTVKIGISLPLSGDMAYAGIPTREAAIMALEEWQDKDTKYNYELIFEDDRFTQKDTASAGNKLMNLDKVNALISIWNLSNYQFREKIKQADIPFLSCSWGHDTHDGNLLFNNQTPHSEHARAMIEVLKKYNAKNVALAGLMSNGDIAVHDYIKQALKDNNINLVFEEIPHYCTTDFRIMIQKMKRTNPDVIMAIMTATELKIFFKQVREAGIQTPITNIDSLEGLENPPMYEGQYAILSSAGTPEFKSKLAKRIDYVHSDCVAAGYDNVNLIIYAFENAKAEPGQIPTTEEMVKVLKGIKHWKGAISDNMSVQDNGRIFSKANIGIMKNGKAVIIEE